MCTLVRQRLPCCSHHPIQIFPLAKRIVHWLYDEEEESESELDSDLRLARNSGKHFMQQRLPELGIGTMSNKVCGPPNFQEQRVLQSFGWIASSWIKVR